MSAIEDSRRLARLSRAVRDSTLKRLRQVPEGRENWTAAPGIMSFADIAFHLAEAGRVNASTRQEYDSLMTDLEATGKERAAALEGMTGPDLAREIDDARFGGKVSVWWIIVRGNLDHEIHHRGQISAYLQTIG